MIIKVSILVLLLFSLAKTGIAQTIIGGTITDSITRQALPYASVWLLKNEKGTISDKNGQFKVNLTTHKLTKDTLYISYIGYQPFVKEINLITDSNINISLSEKPVQLNTVKIIPENAEKILMQALTGIPDNYPDTSMSLLCNFTETVTSDSDTILHIEAKIRIYKGAYSYSDKDRIQLIEGKIIKHDSAAIVWDYLYFVDGPYETLYCDVAKYPESFMTVPELKVNFFNPKHFKYYKYWVGSSVNSNLIEIKFKPSTLRRGVYSGKFTLDKKNNAIVALSYTYDSARMERVLAFPGATQLELEKEGILITDKYYFSEIAYAPFQNKYIISKASSSYSFNLQPSHISNSITITVTDKLQVYDLNTTQFEKIHLWSQLKKQFNLIYLIEKNEKTLKN